MPMLMAWKQVEPDSPSVCIFQGILKETATVDSIVI